MRDHSLLSGLSHTSLAQQFVGVLIILILVMTAGCSASDNPEQQQTTAQQTQEQATKSAEPTPLVATAAPTPPDPVPTPTTQPAPSATPTAEPDPTATPPPTPTPGATLTLGEAKEGVNATNWFAQMDGSVGWQLFMSRSGQPAGEVADWDTTLMVVEGTPEDEWVKVHAPSDVPQDTAWLPTDGVRFEMSDLVLELTRSTGELTLWRRGEVVWSALDAGEQWRRDTHLPIVTLGSTSGTFPSDREGFHPEILGLSPPLSNLDFVALAAIRGVDSFSDVELPGPERQGWAAWITSTELAELIDLVENGARLEIVE